MIARPTFLDSHSVGQRSSHGNRTGKKELDCYATWLSHSHYLIHCCTYCTCMHVMTCSLYLTEQAKLVQLLWPWPDQYFLLVTVTISYYLLGISNDPHASFMQTVIWVWQVHMPNCTGMVFLKLLAQNPHDLPDEWKQHPRTFIFPKSEVELGTKNVFSLLKWVVAAPFVKCN